MNMTLGELFGNVPEGFESMEFPGHLAVDSRDVILGGVFVALEGENTDGHKYIPQAVSNGAGLVIVREGKKPEGLKIPVIELANPERDLADIASRKLQAHMTEHNLHEVIGITGSVGKTTTRAALQKVLAPKFALHAPERSYNTLIGCTATIMAMPIETEIAVLEFGANKPGEIKELTQYFPPTIAILTAVAPVHLEGFGSVEGVLAEKLEITHATSISKIIFNNDNPYLSEAFKYVVKSMGVGEWKDSDFVLAVDRSEYTLPALSFVLSHRVSQEIARFTANIWGKHNAMPLSLAAAVGHELGIPLQESAEALGDFEALEGRGRVMLLDEGHRFLVDDAYNANPASMRASLETFSKVVCAGKIAVLGEMRELGENAAEFHAEMGELFEGITGVILVGEIWREAFPDDEKGYIFVKDWHEAVKAVREIEAEREIQGVLVKGSHSIGLENVVRELTA